MANRQGHPVRPDCACFGPFCPKRSAMVPGTSECTPEREACVTRVRSPQVASGWMLLGDEWVLYLIWGYKMEGTCLHGPFMSFLNQHPALHVSRGPICSAWPPVASPRWVMSLVHGHSLRRAETTGHPGRSSDRPGRQAVQQKPNKYQKHPETPFSLSNLQPSIQTSV